MNPTDLIAASPFVKLVYSYSAAHLVRRLANLGPNGVPPSWCLNSPVHQFVLSVWNELGNVQNVYSNACSLECQVANPTPESWREKFGQSEDEFRQQTLDLFTTIVFSALDRTLLLVNDACDLGMTRQESTLGNTRKRLASGDASICTSLIVLRDAVQPLADSRHFFVHRGESRHIDLFNHMRHARQILKAFKADDISFDDAGAIGKLLGTMRDDALRAAEANRGVLDALTGRFQVRVDELGGIEHPTKSEFARAQEVIRYFAGGPAPKSIPTLHPTT
jgi:hypothetical protein